MMDRMNHPGARGGGFVTPVDLTHRTIASPSEIANLGTVSFPSPDPLRRGRAVQVSARECAAT